MTMLLSNKIKFFFLYVESSIELIPKSLINHPDVHAYAKKRRKKPFEIILDETYHYRALNQSNLPKKEKRGRPDILHRALLLLQDSMLNHYGVMQIFIHTINDEIIFVDPKTRIPRHYLRFIGLFEKLLTDRKIKRSRKFDRCCDNILLAVIPTKLDRLIQAISPDITIGFSKRGRLIRNFEEYMGVLISNLLRKKSYIRILNIIGGFPKGYFSEEINRLLDTVISLAERSLSTSYVTCRLITHYENILAYSDVSEAGKL